MKLLFLGMSICITLSSETTHSVQQPHQAAPIELHTTTEAPLAKSSAALEDALKINNELKSIIDTGNLLPKMKQVVKLYNKKKAEVVHLTEENKILKNTIDSILAANNKPIVLSDYAVKDTAVVVIAGNKKEHKLAKFFKRLF